MYKGASKYQQHLSFFTAIRGFEKKTVHRNEPPKVITKNIMKQYKAGHLLNGEVKGEVKGGYRIKIGNCMAFCPYSEMYGYFRQAKVKSKKIVVKIIKLSLPSTVIVSSKKPFQMNTMRLIKKAYDEKTPIVGTVKIIKPYGAFIDLNKRDRYNYVLSL